MEKAAGRKPGRGWLLYGAVGWPDHQQPMLQLTHGPGFSASAQAVGTKMGCQCPLHMLFGKAQQRSCPPGAARSPEWSWRELWVHARTYTAMGMGVGGFWGHSELHGDRAGDAEPPWVGPAGSTSQRCLALAQHLSNMVPTLG